MVGIVSADGNYPPVNGTHQRVVSVLVDSERRLIISPLGGPPPEGGISSGQVITGDTLPAAPFDPTIPAVFYPRKSAVDAGTIAPEWKAWDVEQQLWH